MRLLFATIDIAIGTMFNIQPATFLAADMCTDILLPPLACLIEPPVVIDNLTVVS